MNLMPLPPFFFSLSLLDVPTIPDLALPAHCRMKKNTSVSVGVEIGTSIMLSGFSVYDSLSSLSVDVLVIGSTPGSILTADFADSIGNLFW
jgi:hypothetical protein